MKKSTATTTAPAKKNKAKKKGPSLKGQIGRVLDRLAAIDVDDARRNAEIGLCELEETFPGLLQALQDQGHVALDKDGQLLRAFVPYGTKAAYNAPRAEGPEGWRELAFLMNRESLLALPECRRSRALDALMRNSAERNRREAVAAWVRKNLEPRVRAWLEEKRLERALQAEEKKLRGRLRWAQH